MAPIKADVVITYDMCDVEFVKKLCAKLKQENVNFWTPPPGENSQAINLVKGQALLNCKVFIMVMSPDSLGNEDLCDELSLAYISNKSILPLGLAYFRKLAAKMNGGLKLMLAKIQMTFFVTDFDKNFTIFLEAINREIAAYDSRQRQASRSTEGAEGEEDPSGMTSGPLNAQYRSSVLYHPDAGGAKERRRRDDDEKERDDTERDEDEDTESVGFSRAHEPDFWDRHFSGQREATWSDFREKFLSDYEERIAHEFGDDTRKKWLINLMYRDLFELLKSIKYTTYNSFTYGKAGAAAKSGGDAFYDRLREYSIGSFAMREVFNMESSVRLTAVQNLGSFQTPAVVSALFDLIQDNDPNIRAVAALALAKTGKRTKVIERTLLKLLNDEDRLVRESTCLSLAHMRSQMAVPHIIDTWRNDPIKHVREAAEVALSRIGGEEASQAINITRVLSEEMNDLRLLPRP